MTISRVLLDGDARWVAARGEGHVLLTHPLSELLGMPLADARVAIEASAEATSVDGLTYLAPVDEQEVWAAGVTYLRSRDGRAEEAADPSIYDRVYAAERPEVFLKATANRVVADGEPVGIRADSTWDVPEPELGIIINSSGQLFGYVVANDMSSRSIEGENPLYLPQAKVYDRSCALGRVIVPVWDAPDGAFPISLSIKRTGIEVFTGSTSTASIARPLEQLAEWLGLALTFPVGVVLLTGTGVVPEADFTLREGDVVTIEIGGIGVLTNPVTVVGRAR
jgi:2-dehydro-3-deoxy-D-arabinonate dehydratase